MSDECGRVPGRHRKMLGGTSPGLWLGVLLIALWVSGCGFQLRGQMGLPFRTVYVEGGGQLGIDLKRTFVANGVQVKDGAEAAQVVLRILSEDRGKHILSISGGGKVKEYNMRYQVAYQLDSPRGGNLLPKSEIVLNRDMTYDDTQILGKGEEEKLLWRDMEQDAVQQILLRLSRFKFSPDIS
jgi:LPS-assembly lipoprotein